MLATLLLALAPAPATAAGPASAPVSAAAPSQSRNRDPITELQRWTERYSRRRRPLEAVDEQALAALVADVSLLQIAEPDRRREALLALLDLASLEAAGGERAGGRVVPGSATGRLRARGREAAARVLEADAEGELATWLASSVLSLPHLHPLPRRLAAVEVLGRRREAGTMLALFSCGMAPERELREAAIAALAGWENEAVHRFLLQQLERSRTQPGWVSPRLVQRHFASVTLEQGSPASRELAEWSARRTMSTDWREAMRALELLRALPDADAVPVLIEGLAAWAARGRRGVGSRRVEGGIVGELQRRSGRSIGAHPERWTVWWKAVSSGKLAPGPAEGPAQVTSAGFFGLRPATDRVVFVIDRSGSMLVPFGTAGHSRYEEAVEQMTAFLRSLGEGTRFRVVLFADGVWSWERDLQPANDKNIESARRWLLSRHPNGGTFLRPGIEEALRIGRDGRPDLERLEADTLIVLCDGATSEGPGWVEPLLEGPAGETMVAIHGVQIGMGGDGTLQLLAERTGGDFARVLE